MMTLHTAIYIILFDGTLCSLMIADTIVQKTARNRHIGPTVHNGKTHRSLVALYIVARC